MFFSKPNYHTVWTSTTLLVFLTFLTSCQIPHTEYRYGRIINENGDPVPNAYVQMNIDERVSPDLRRTEFQLITRTDTAGVFSLRQEWRGNFFDDFPYPLGETSYTVEIQACHPDYIPVRDRAPRTLEWREHVRQNKEEILLTFNKHRQTAPPYYWDAALSFDDEIRKECRLTVQYPR